MMLGRSLPANHTSVLNRSSVQLGPAPQHELLGPALHPTQPQIGITARGELALNLPRPSLLTAERTPPAHRRLSVEEEAGSGSGTWPPPASPPLPVPPALPPPPPPSAPPIIPAGRESAAVAATVGTFLGAVVVGAGLLVFRRDRHGGGPLRGMYASLAGSRAERQQQLLDEADGGRPPMIRELLNAVQDVEVRTL